MTAPPPKFPFVDATFAAEMLGVQPADVMGWIAEGRLQTFGGKERNPFVRTADVERLAQSLGRQMGEPAKKRRATENPVRRVELRIRHDTRWTDITDDDLVAWAREQDEHSLAAAKRVAETTRSRLERLLEIATSRETA